MARWLVLHCHQGQAISYGEHCNSLQSTSCNQNRLWQVGRSYSWQRTPMFSPKQYTSIQTRCASFHSLGVWQWHKQPSQWWNHLWWSTWCQVMYISSRVVPGLITCYTSINWCDDQILDSSFYMYVQAVLAWCDNQILDVAPRLYSMSFILYTHTCGATCGTMWTMKHGEHGDVCPGFPTYQGISIGGGQTTGAMDSDCQYL